ncbi:hypothetical protein TRAPUB_819 [Trametes pubescens]|uniref:Uncharacterized protein n=1 Tax=Trametes pubescens TaxID=154538 RepID=A0A1M2VL36_TRAPU|nr:hypothetical protein TRAPUB_819 [Trametes pubescens]
MSPTADGCANCLLLLKLVKLVNSPSIMIVPDSNPYASEKQPVQAGFSPAVAPTHYDEPPPSYGDRTPQGSSQQWAPNGAYQNAPRPTLGMSNAGQQFYAPPPGPPPSFQTPTSSSSRIADYNPSYPAGSGYGPPSAPHNYPPQPSQSTQRFPALLTPPPPSFQRAPSRSMPYGSFEPLEVPAAGKGLEDGFATTLPSSRTQPHPFGTHDVKESDWLRFLDDVKRAGVAAVRDRAPSQSAPQIGLRGGLLSGLLAQGIQSMQGTKLGPRDLAPVVELLQYWNQYFFNPRSMEVDLNGPVNDQDDTPTAPSPGFGGRRERLAGRRRGGPLSGGLIGLETIRNATSDVKITTCPWRSFQHIETHRELANIIYISFGQEH